MKPSQRKEISEKIKDLEKRKSKAKTEIAKQICEVALIALKEQLLSPKERQALEEAEYNRLLDEENDLLCSDQETDF